MATVIRVTKGYGSNPKAWAVIREPGRHTQVGEFDLSEEPGWYDPVGNGINGMSGIIWNPDGTISDRLLYNSLDEWVSDISAVYPGAEIVVDMTSGPNWP